MHIRNAFSFSAFLAAVLISAGTAAASSDPRGVWIDHTGRGAVEITDCGDGLCGKLVWLKDAENTQACGIQILGEVKPVKNGVWDKGWIYDPEQDAKYSVELKPLGEDKLQVMGYLGTKLLSETMVWTRAPENLERCSTPRRRLQRPLRQPSRNPRLSPRRTVQNHLPRTARFASGQNDGNRTAEADKPSGKTEPQTTRRKTAGPRECTLNTPWVSLSFPCPN